MHIKLTEYVRATTLTLNIKDAPMTALPLIKDAFAKLATDLEELMEVPKFIAPSDAIVKIDPSEYETGFYQTAQGTVIRIAPTQETVDALNTSLGSLTEQPAKRRGRPPKVKVEEPAPVAEPTPLEQAIANAEDEQSQGERPNGAEPAEVLPTPPTPTAEPATSQPVSDSDLQKYCVKLAQHYGGPQKVFDLAKPFVEEGAVPRPSNIKGDDKRWQFIKAVEADSGHKYHG